MIAPHLYVLPAPVVRMKARRELEEMKREMQESLARLDDAVAFVKKMTGQDQEQARMN